MADGFDASGRFAQGESEMVREFHKYSFVVIWREYTYREQKVKQTLDTESSMRNFFIFKSGVDENPLIEIRTLKKLSTNIIQTVDIEMDFRYGIHSKDN
jgi:hypothetical protein